VPTNVFAPGGASNVGAGTAALYAHRFTAGSAGSVALSSTQDATPSFTVFTAAACGTLGSGLSGCGVTTQPAVGAAGPVKWTLNGGLAPGATGTVSYQVRVQ
jgi:hypothetical protein